MKHWTCINFNKIARLYIYSHERLDVEIWVPSILEWLNVVYTKRLTLSTASLISLLRGFYLSKDVKDTKWSRVLIPRTRIRVTGMVLTNKELLVLKRKRKQFLSWLTAPLTNGCPAWRLCQCPLNLPLLLLELCLESAKMFQIAGGVFFSCLPTSVSTTQCVIFLSTKTLSDTHEWMFEKRKYDLLRRDEIWISDKSFIKMHVELYFQTFTSS